MFKKYLKKILVIFFVVCLFVGIIPAINYSENIVLAAALEGGYENEGPISAALIENLSQEVQVYNPYSAGTGKTLFKFVTSSSGQYRITLSSADKTFGWQLYNDNKDNTVTGISGAASVSSMNYSFDAVSNQTFILQLYGASSDFTATLNIIPPTPAPTYTITAIDNQTLSALTAGYTSGSQQTKTVTIERTGTGDLANLTTALSGTNADSFTITQPEVTTLNSGNPSTTFTVKAKDGLVAGTYTATVTVSSTNMTNMTFTVTQLVGEEAPVVTAVNIDPGTYGPATGLDFMVHFSEPVEIDTAGGVPYLDINIGGAQRRASFFAKNGASELLFRYDILPSDITDVDGIEMEPTLNMNGGTIKSVADSDNANTTISLIDDLSGVLVDTMPPSVISAVITGMNNYIRVNFTKDVHNGSGGPIDASDLTLTFSKNGGNATNVVISSVTDWNGTALTLPSSSIQLNLNVIGFASGVETIEIKPASSTSIYDMVGNAMSTSQSSGILQLYNTLPSDLASPTAGNGGVITNTAKSSSSATITWTAATDDVTAQSGLVYTVKRSTTNLGTDPVAISNSAVTVQGWTTNITSYTASGLNANTTYYFYVGVRDMAGKNTLYTPIAVTTDAVSGGGSGGSGSSGSSGGTTPPVVPPTDIPVFKINLMGNADLGVGILTGDKVKRLESKDGIVEVKTVGVTYTLPSSQINISNVQSQLGANALSDIRVNIGIGKPAKDTLSIVADKEKAGEFKVVAQPVDFTVNCTYKDKVLEIEHFNAYVERTIAVPDGVDPSKITTGVVVRPDGTVYHVPTKIEKIGEKYFAKINSLTNSTYAVIYNEVKFKDMGNHWAKNAVNDMGSRMVISGDASGNFAPDRAITRAEFAAIIVRALGLAPTDGANNFTDVADKDWFNGYVNTAVSYGIITGYDAKTFVPNDKITREQAMTMISRAMAIADKAMVASDGEKASLLGKFKDNSGVSAYAEKGVASCIKAGIISGRTVDTIAPKSNISRAEVAAAIQRMLQKAELI